MKQTLGEYFMERLQKEHKEIASVYQNLFKILGTEQLDGILDWVYKDFQTGSESWFWSFHKSMRQTDFFGGDFDICKITRRRKGQEEKKGESISGYLDMILWNLVHVDEKDFLQKFMQDVFEDYKHFKSKENATEV